MKIKSLLTLLLTGATLVACNAGTSANSSIPSTNSTNHASANDMQASDIKISNQLTVESNYPSYLVGYHINCSYYDNGITYVGTESGLFISKDMGKSWELKTTENGLTSNSIKNMTISGHSLFLVTGTYLNVSYDGGNTWKTAQMGEEDIVNSVYINNETIYAGTPTLGLYASTDNGDTWHSYQVDAGEALSMTIKDISGYGKATYLATNNGIYTSLDNGKSWTKQMKEITEANTIYVSSIGNIYVGLTNGSVAASMDGGKTIKFYDNLQSGQTTTHDINEMDNEIIVANNSYTLYGK